MIPLHGWLVPAFVICVLPDLWVTEKARINVIAESAARSDPVDSQLFLV